MLPRAGRILFCSFVLAWSFALEMRGQDSDESVQFACAWPYERVSQSPIYPFRNSNTSYPAGLCNLTCPSNIQQNNAPGFCSANVIVPDVAYSGDCLVASLNWQLSGATSGSGTGQIGPHLFNVGVTNILYIISDSNGDTDSCAFTVTIIDNQPPTLTCPSGSPFTRYAIAGQCYYIVQGNEFNPSFSDNCPGASIINDFNSSSTLTGAQLPQGTTSITWTATDAAGSTSTCSITINVIDSQSPVITCPPGSPFTRNTDAGECFHTVQGNEFDPSFSDNCSGASVTNNFNGTGTLAGVQLPKGSNIIAWTVTDGAGLTASCVITVNVTDNQPPAITCPPGSPFSRNAAAGQCSYPVQGNEFDPTFSDNCAGSAIQNNFNGSNTLAGAQLPRGSNVITWTATDAAGLTATCVITVNVADDQPPEIACPAGSPFNRNTTNGNCYYVVQGSEFNPTFSDNCPGTTIINSFNSSGTLNGAQLPKGSTNITWTATDASGLTATCLITVDIADILPPVITCPPGSPFSRNCEAGQCYYSVQGNEFNPTFSDNCPGTTIQNSYNSTGSLTGEQLPKGNHTITWTATDASGLTATCAITVNVYDNQPPVITCPPGSPFSRNADAGGCHYTAQGNEFDATYWDNCPGASLVNDFNSSGTLVGAQIPKGNTVITWTATDAAGLTATCAITIQVTDNQPPSITCPPGNPFSRNTDSGECYYTVQGNEFNPTFSDNCPGATIQNNFNSTSTLAGAHLPKGNTVITWTATDGAGLTATCSITVQVADNEPPAINCPPGSPFSRNTASGQCHYTVQGSEFNPTFSDNCPGTTVLNDHNGSNTLNGVQLPKGSTTITWTATDAAGLTATCSITIQVIDNQPPGITCPPGSPFNRNTTSGSCFYTVQGNEFNASFYDNCTGASIVNDFNGTNTLTGEQLPKGTTTVLWTATDASGLTATCSIQVNVNDNQPPVLSCPPGSPFYRNTDVGLCYYLVQGPEFDPVYSDNCAGASLVNSLNGSVTLAGTQLPVGNTTITWTATDAGGLTSTCAITIHVTDNQAPSISCPAGSPFNRNMDAGLCYYTVQGAEFDPTFSDNCPGVVITNSFSSTPSLADERLPRGSNTIIWTATDASGLTATCSITVNIIDNQLPVITCPPGSPFNRNTDPGLCYYTVQGSEFNPTYTDNCSIASILNDFNSSSTLEGAQLPKGTHTIAWRVTDNSGLTASCSITVTVADNQLPAITCPPGSPFNRSTDAGKCYYTVQGTEFNAIFSDNCAGSSLTNDFNGSNTLTGAQLLPGSRTVIWTVTDASGNKASCSINIVITDSQFPILTCPANIDDTVQGNTCWKKITTPHPVFSDNCGVTRLIWQMTGNTIDNSPLTGINYVPPLYKFNTGYTTVTYTAFDAANNSTACSFIVMLADKHPPDIICPSNQVRNTNPGVCTYTAIGTEFDLLSVEDNCPGVITVTNNYNGLSTLAGAVFPKGITSVVWTAFDAGPNYSTCSFTITVNDSEKPIIICPPSASRNTDPGQCTYTIVGNEFDPVVTDNCPGSIITNSFNNSSTLAGAVIPKGSATITWTVMDASGLTSSCNFTVTVNDNQPPVITCPAGSPLIRNTNIGKCTYTVQGNEFNPTFTDNCPGAVAINNFNMGVTLAGAILPIGNTTIKWTANDAAGLTASCSIIVTVRDNQAPVITCPLNITVNNTPSYCSAFVTVNNPVMSDNCGVTTLRWVMTGATTGSSPLTGINYVGTKSFNVGVTTVTYTAIDAGNNSTNCSFTVTVNDIQPPTILCPPGNPFTRGTNPAGCYYIVAGNEFNPTVTDNCPGVTYRNNYNNLNTLANAQLPLGVTVITWTATDAKGLMSSCNITINIVDNTPPVITCPPGISVTCPSDIPEPDPTLTSSWDNCGFTTVSHYMDNYQGLGIVPGFCPEAVERTYRATDGNGNVKDCMQLITVLDECDCPTCQTHVPHFWVNLSGNSDSTWISPSIRRDGLCCEAKSPERCVSFSVMIDENTIGFHIYIDGATPPGHYYQVDCGPQIPMSEIVCIPPLEYHTISFCKPGANENIYTIQAVSGLIVGEEVSTRVDCERELTVSGVTESTVTWTDITGGGIYNSYLSCDSACLTTYFTPDINSPPIIDYLVCGEVAGNPCNNGASVCDTVRVNIFPAIGIVITPYPPIFCSYHPKTIYAAISPPGEYEITWWDSWNGTGNMVGTGFEYTAPTPGPYSITVIDYISGLPCSYDTLNFEVELIECSACPEQYHCEEEEIEVYTTIDAFTAAGGQIDFPCEVMNSSIALVNQQSDNNQCPELITHTYEIWDVCGNKSRCDVLITLNDTVPPTFTLPDLSDKHCVANIYHAVYNPNGSYEEDTDLTYPRPNYYLMPAGDTMLDLMDIADYCSDPEDLVISWQIDLGLNGSIDLTGTGQISSAPAIYFPLGESLITYSVTDTCGNITSDSVILLVEPRPDIQDNY